MKKIIILDKLNDGPNTKPTFNYLMWADVPQTRWQYFSNPSAISAYSLATVFEINALKSGMIVEKVDYFTVPANSTFASMRAELTDIYNQFQSEISGNAKNSWQRYGTFWDGNSWTNSGVN